MAHMSHGQDSLSKRNQRRADVLGLSSVAPGSMLDESWSKATSRVFMVRPI